MREPDGAVAAATVPRRTGASSVVVEAANAASAVGTSWRMDETYLKVAGRWQYPSRAAGREGSTVDFLLTARRDATAARRFLERAIALHGEPEKITADKSPVSNGLLLRKQTHEAGQVLTPGFRAFATDDAAHEVLLHHDVPGLAPLARTLKARSERIMQTRIVRN